MNMPDCKPLDLLVFPLSFPRTQKTISVDLEEHSLDHEPLLYEAVSYCWGHGARDITIKCQERIIYITENLKSELLRLRCQYTARILWIYTVCIDQDNLEERSDQVQLMGEVFKRAFRRLVWLGEADSTTKLVYDCMKCLMSKIFNMDHTSSTHISKLPNKAEAYEYLELSVPNSSPLYALERLFSRPWFYRA